MFIFGSKKIYEIQRNVWKLSSENEYFSYSVNHNFDLSICNCFDVRSSSNGSKSMNHFWYSGGQSSSRNPRRRSFLMFSVGIRRICFDDKCRSGSLNKSIRNSATTMHDALCMSVSSVVRFLRREVKEYERESTMPMRRIVVIRINENFMVYFVCIDRWILRIESDSVSFV